MSLENSSCHDEHVAAVARAPAARGLTSLGLNSPCVTLEGVRALARSAGLPCLKDLRLHRSDLVAEGAELPGEPAGLRGLTSLSLTGCRFNSEGARAFERLLDLRTLRTLGLHVGPCNHEDGRQAWVACAGRWAAAATGLTTLTLIPTIWSPARSRRCCESPRACASSRRCGLPGTNGCEAPSSHIWRACLGSRTWTWSEPAWGIWAPQSWRRLPASLRSEL